jgi:hypothetical protein
VSVSPEHEALHRIFQHDPALFARAVARVLDIKMTEPCRMSELNVDLTETRPIERRADSVLRAEFMIEDTEGDYILIIESQTDPENTRRKSWPYYITFVQNKYDCDVVLLVVCSKAATAKWAREPIRVGRRDLICLTVNPVVLGPDNVPTVTSVAEATSDLPFAVFSALTHSRGPKANGILETLAAALNTADADIAANLAEFTEAGLGDTPGLQIWRALMATETFSFVSEMRAKGRAEGHAEGHAEGRAEGHAEGLAEAVLRVLERRKVTVDDVSQQRIESCTDLKALETWLDRSLTVITAEELFED